MIRIRNLKKIYETDGISTNALNGINLEITKGEFVAIMGASGSGKTTLLNIIGGMDRPTSGEYFFDNVEIHNMSVNELHLFRKNNISFVFQSFELMKYYTVFENVEMPLIAKNIKKKLRKKIVDEVLEKVGIADLSGKFPSQISGGQKQRTAIARALASGNEIILADEPTGSLDRQTGKEIMEIFSSLNKIGKTIILITHDKNVASIADRIITISDGCLTL